MKINKAFKYRLKPSDEQATLLKQCGGNARFLWNYFWNLQLDYYNDYKQYLSGYDLNYFLPLLKKAFGFQFLNNSFSQSLCQISDDLKKAISRAFDDDIKAKRKKAIAKAMAETDETKKKKKLAKAYKYGFPKFKKKHNFEDSFRISTRFKIAKSRIYVPQIGWIDYIKHRNFVGKPKYITISQDGTEWYVSICCELEIEDKEIKTDNVVGMDLGLNVFASLSDKTEIANPKFYRKEENKVKREDKKLSRKENGSNRKKKQQNTCRKVHKRISNKRTNFIHQTTHDMITKYDGFVLEDLAVDNMMKNHNRAKSVQDAAWSEFSRVLEYKCLWNFKYFEKIDRFAPSSQLCSNCGYRQKMPPEIRTYECPQCGLVIDRDLNASYNILAFSVLNEIRNMEHIPNTSGREEIYGHGEPALAGSLNCQKEQLLA